MNIWDIYKAKKLGYADSLFKSLLGKKAATYEWITESVPYRHRISANGANISSKCIDRIVGGSLVWNQLCEKGDFSSIYGYWSDTNGTLTVSNNVANLVPSGTKTGTLDYGIRGLTDFTVNHKYFVTFTAKSTKADKYRGRYANQVFWTGSVPANTWVTGATILTNSSVTSDSPLFAVYAYNDSQYTSSDVISFKNFMVIDLTKMFGSSLADYIYSLETATAGAGVAFFKKLGFNKPYYAYNPGELKHVSGLVSHDTVGFNQFDDTLELGSISGSGDPTIADTRCRTDYIPALSNTEYGFCLIGQSSGQQIYEIHFYDTEKKYISFKAINSTIGSWTTPDGTAYIRILLRWSDNRVTSISEWEEKVCLYIRGDGSRDGEYEPYVKHSYSLDDSLTLRGIPKLDANNILYYDGDTYESDGTVTRMYGIRAYQSGDVTDGSTMITDGTNTVYKLTTPTTETAEPFTKLQKIVKGGTEEYVESNSDVLVPVGHITQYQVAAE